MIQRFQNTKIITQVIIFNNENIDFRSGFFLSALYCESEMQLYWAGRLHHQQPSQKQRWNNQPCHTAPDEKPASKIIIKKKERIHHCWHDAPNRSSPPFPIPLFSLIEPLLQAACLGPPSPMCCLPLLRAIRGKIGAIWNSEWQAVTGAWAASMQDGWPGLKQESSNK